jgi:hypothetical protein
MERFADLTDILRMWDFAGLVEGSQLKCDYETQYS